MNLKNELTLDMLPTKGKCREIAERIGIDNFITLTEILGGVTFYLPKLDSLTKPIRDQHIKDEFTGYNHYELAMKYNISERWVRELCGDGFLEGQTSMFEGSA
jgi:Mor family transcriptional regulator